MGRPSQLVKIEQKDVIAAATKTAGAVIPAKATWKGGRMPTGDLGVERLTLRYNGLTDQGVADGTVVTDGQLRYLRQLDVISSALGPIVDKMDGLSLARILAMEYGTPAPTLQAASNANDQPFNAEFPLSMLMPKKYIRPKDTLLDMNKDSLIVDAQFGSYTDIISGGTATNTIDMLKADLTAEVLPGPLVTKEGPGYELPGWYRYWKKYTEDVSSAKSQRVIELDFGFDIVEKVFVSQRDANGAEIATLVLDESIVSLLVNRQAWVDRVTWKELKDRYKAPSGLESKFTGWGCVFDASEHGSILDLLSLIATNSGTFQLVLDQENVTGKLHIVTQCVRPLPPDAVRPKGA